MNESSELAKSLEALVQTSKGIPNNKLVQEIAAAAPIAPGYGAKYTQQEVKPLRGYWRSVRKHLSLIIGVTALITTLSIIYVSRKADEYDAVALVQVDLENANSGLGAAKNGAVVFSSPNDPAYFNTQLQILTRAGLLRRVVKTLDLDHNTGFLQSDTQKLSTWQKWLQMVGLRNKSPEPGTAEGRDGLTLNGSVARAMSRADLDEAIRLDPYVIAIQSKLKAVPIKEERLPIKDTRLIEITFTHNNPKMAAKVVNTIVDAFVLSNLEKKVEVNATAGDFLQKRIAELQSSIRGDEERLVNYGTNHEILSLDAGQNTVVDRLTGLNRQLLEAENERKLAEAQYRASLEPGAAEALAEEGTDKQYSAKYDVESKLTELRKARAQLLVEYTEDWPEVKEIDQEIAVLEQHKNEIHNGGAFLVKKNLETRYRQALTREEALRKSFDEQRSTTLTQNEAAINYKIIQQEITTNKTLLDGLLQRSKENDVILAGTPNNIRVVEYAIPPSLTTGPGRLLIVSLAGLVAIILGIFLALLLEYLDDTIHSTEDVETFLRLPALAVIPTIGRAFRSRLLPSTNVLQLRGGNSNDRPELLVNADPKSAIAEAYRQLRTSVLLSTAGRPPKTLLVTSSIPSEGKTTTSVNVAISLAQTGSKVLLIDGDMRRPRLHSIFGFDNANGLSTILSSNMSEAEMLSMIHVHEGTGIYLLTSGPIPPNSAELLGSEQMRQLMSILSMSFNHIVIDSPPVASFTDGVLVASLVDGVLLVVRGDESSRAVVQRTQQILRDVGGKIIGVVLNNVNLRSKDYYYYRDYYHESYYGPKDQKGAGASRVSQINAESGPTAP